ncbi:MAG: phosphomethylpyrimidine synthase ThiC, partial [Myxococcota bacterium]
MTQLELARQGRVTDEMGEVARSEGRTAEYVRERVAAGRIAITRNTGRTNPGILGIGEGLRTKINSNVGTSRDTQDLSMEIEKARVSVEAGADTIMDLSTGGDLVGIRKALMSSVRVPVGTVPIYQAAVRASEKRKSLLHMTADEMFGVIEEQAREGVDFMTVHCGVVRESRARMDFEGRVLDVVSRGGA